MFAITDQLRKSLISKVTTSSLEWNEGEDGLKKDYLPQSLIEKFTCEALVVYKLAVEFFQMWFKFEQS